MDDRKSMEWETVGQGIVMRERISEGFLVCGQDDAPTEGLK